MIGRMLRAMRLDASLYEEVEANPYFNTESFYVVLLVAALSGIIGGFVQSVFLGGGFNLGQVIGLMVLTFVGYFVSAFLVWLIGSGVFGGAGSLGEVRRALGYAYAPYIFGGIPCVNLLAALWMMAAFFVAVRQTLDIGNGKTIVVILVAGAAQLVLYLVFAAFGLAAAAFGGGF